MTSDALLRFDKVGCRRGGAMLFSGLSFDVASGGALLLHGTNGAGKSSLIRVAAGLLKPAAGNVTRNGDAGLLTHDVALDDGLSLEQALSFWSRLDGVAASAVNRGLAEMGLTQLAVVPVRFLSSGQRRRAALARVIAGGARLWLLDEPGVGLDSASLAMLASAIRRHRSEGGAVVAATHMDLALDDAATLELGRPC